MKNIFALFVLLWANTAFSQSYVGIGLGYSHANLPIQSHECADCSFHEYDDSYNQLQAYFGYRRNAWAIEAGGGSLSKYRTHNIRPGRPADIRQEIDTRRLYVQAIRFFPVYIGVELFAAIGFARVTMKNHEYGYNQSSREFVEQVNYDTRTKPMFGFGVQYKINKSYAARIEFNKINNVAVSHWTLHQDVESIWLGLQSRF